VPNGIDNVPFFFPLGFGPGDTNLYRDVGNRPTNQVDPLGLWSTNLILGSAQISLRQLPLAGAAPAVGGGAAAGGGGAAGGAGAAGAGAVASAAAVIAVAAAATAGACWVASHVGEWIGEGLGELFWPLVSRPLPRPTQISNLAQQHQLGMHGSLSCVRGGAGVDILPFDPTWGRGRPPRPPRRRNPGDCTPQEHAALQLAVDTACKRGKRRCTADQDLATLQLNLARNLACAAARDAINWRCYRGGDAGHRRAAIEAQRAAENCTRLILGPGRR
jgi:Novel toxin 16